MQDSLILSTFADTPANAHARMDRAALTRPAEHLILVLRALACMEALAAVATLFDATSGHEWLLQFAQTSAGIIPATLLWLALACATLPLLPPGRAVRILVCALQGAFCGSFGTAMALTAGLPCSNPWMGGLLGGALLATLFVSRPPRSQDAGQRRGTPARMNELQAGIRLHFLANTLNSALALLRSEPDRAETLLEDLGDLLRQALRDPGTSVTLQDELELTERYLSIEQVRFGHRLRVHWKLDPLASDAQLPPLLLQPLVENAVRHGVEPSPEGARIDISTAHLGDAVLIEVVNTLPGGPGADGLGLGLRNLWHRLRLLHDDRCHVSIQRRGSVFRVRLEIPA